MLKTPVKHFGNFAERIVSIQTDTLNKFNLDIDQKLHCINKSVSKKGQPQLVSTLLKPNIKKRADIKCDIRSRRQLREQEL